MPMLALRTKWATVNACAAACARPMAKQVLLCAQASAVMATGAWCVAASSEASTWPSGAPKVVQRTMGPSTAKHAARQAPSWDHATVQAPAPRAAGVLVGAGVALRETFAVGGASSDFRSWKRWSLVQE